MFFYVVEEANLQFCSISYRSNKQNSDALKTHIFMTLVTFKRTRKLYNLISW